MPSEELEVCANLAGKSFNALSSTTRIDDGRSAFPTEIFIGPSSRYVITVLRYKGEKWPPPFGLSSVIRKSSESNLKLSEFKLEEKLIDSEKSQAEPASRKSYGCRRDRDGQRCA
jgi:hypothetical protein